MLNELFIQRWQIRRVVMLLLIGVVVTIAAQTAIATAARNRDFTSRRHSRIVQVGQYVVLEESSVLHSVSTIGPVGTDFVGGEKVEYSPNTYLVHGLLDALGTNENVQLTRVGWPLRSCYWTQVSSSVVLDGTFEGRVGRWRLLLPYRMLWLSLFGNVIFWSGVMCLIRWTIISVRRWRRTMKGDCVACGYPVIALKQCPECGRATTTAYTIAQ